MRKGPVGSTIIDVQLMTEKRLKNIVILDHLQDYKEKRRKIRIGRSRKAVFALPFISKFMAVFVLGNTDSLNLQNCRKPIKSVKICLCTCHSNLKRTRGFVS